MLLMATALPLLIVVFFWILLCATLLGITVLIWKLICLSDSLKNLLELKRTQIAVHVQKELLKNPSLQPPSPPSVPLQPQKETPPTKAETVKTESLRENSSLEPDAKNTGDSVGTLIMGIIIIVLVIVFVALTIVSP